MTPAEVIEKALHQHFALRLTPSALKQAQRGHPLWLSGAQAEDAARIALDALAGAGLVVVSAEDLGSAVEVLEAVNDPWRHISEEPELLARLRAALLEEKTDG